MSRNVPPQVRRRALVFLAIAGAVMWVPLGQAMAGQAPRFLRNLGFADGPAGTPLAWVMAGLVAVAYVWFSVSRIPLVRMFAFAPSPTKLFAVGVAVAAAVVEEAVFRRMLMDAMLDAGWATPWQVIASGVVFGVAHASWSLVTGKVAAGLGAMVATTALGTALGGVYVLGDRSLAPVIAAHFVVTATIQPGLMFAAFSGRMRPGD